jgi:hypothetical protein
LRAKCIQIKKARAALDFLATKPNVEPARLLELLWTWLASGPQTSTQIRADRKKSRRLEKQLDRLQLDTIGLEELNREYDIPPNLRAEHLLRENHRAICREVIRSNPGVWAPTAWSEKRTGTGVAMLAIGWVAKQSGRCYYGKMAAILNASFRVAKKERKFSNRSLCSLWRGKQGELKGRDDVVAKKGVPANKHLGSSRWILDVKPEEEDKS